MDTPSPITHLGLCAGYGGIEIGLHRAIPNMRTVALCEIEAFACSNLVAKMEAGLMDCAPIWTDLKTFPWAEFRDRVDILTGGYPCQPFSAAGKRLGTEDPRHLWPFIAGGIRILRPKLCFFENVEGHISLGLREVIGDLGAAGYTAAWGIFSASEVGAPHQRKRVFILAYREGERLPQFANIGAIEREVCTIALGAKLANGNEQRLERGIQQGISPKQKQDEFVAGYGCTLANSNGARGWEDRESSESWAACTEQPSSDSRGGKSGQIREGQAWPSRPGEPQHGWEPPRVVGNADSPRQQERPRQRGAGIQGTDADGGADAGGEIEQPMGDPVDGTKFGVGLCELSGLSDWELAEIREWMVKTDNRTDELRLLGNGVVPATAERAFRTLWEELLK